MPQNVVSDQCLLTNFFDKKYWHIWDINVWNFNETLTNDVASFEALVCTLTCILGWNHNLSKEVVSLIGHESRNKEQSIANKAEKDPMILVGIEPRPVGQ